MPCNASSADVILNALADQHRRLVLRQVGNTDTGVASYDDVIDGVVRHSSTAETPEAVMARLHHETLPALEAAGLIENDTRSETIQYQSQPLAEDILDCVHE
ncbi:DUF7344 domain-containing protein [Natrinema soli]|uniref:DUF7344 domain-containing protein n=1 Tax=Natrinema soli TaxID=1930624 RepID=UPI003CCCCEBC